MSAPRILLVDDDSLMLKMVSRILRPGGYEVICASTGQQALDAVKAGDLALVLLDIHMPDFSGFELISRIRSLHGDGLPILMLTGSADDDSERLARELGVDGYFEKPFHTAELLSAIAETIERGRQ